MVNLLTVPQAAHCLQYRSCYAETDQMGRVYYGNYLTWFERARTALLRDAGFPYGDLEQRGILLPVRHCEVRYFQGVGYDVVVDLRTWVSQIRRTTLKLTTAVCHLDDTTPLVIGIVELATVNTSFKPIPLPADVTAAVQQYLYLSS